MSTQICRAASHLRSGCPRAGNLSYTSSHEPLAPSAPWRAGGAVPCPGTPSGSSKPHPQAVVSGRTVEPMLPSKVYTLPASPSSPVSTFSLKTFQLLCNAHIQSRLLCLAFKALHNHQRSFPNHLQICFSPKGRGHPCALFCTLLFVLEHPCLLLSHEYSICPPKQNKPVSCS